MEFKFDSGLFGLGEDPIGEKLPRLLGRGFFIAQENSQVRAGPGHDTPAQTAAPGPFVA